MLKPMTRVVTGGTQRFTSREGQNNSFLINKYKYICVCVCVRARAHACKYKTGI